MSEFRLPKIIVLLLCQFVCQTAPCSLQTYPYAVSLRISGTLSHFCGGTLLQRRWVLTAGHCTQDFTDPSIIVVMAVTTKNKIAAKEIFHCETYDPKTLQNDISLLYLSDNFPESFIFGKLAGWNFTDHCFAVTVVGWEENRRKENKRALVPHCMDVLLEKRDFCQTFFSVAIEEEMLCTSFGAFGEQPCRGDSGGPLICTGVVIGMVSFGMECDMRFQPSVFARVDRLLDFVRSSLKEHNFTLQPTKVGNFTVYFVPARSTTLHKCPFVVALALSLMLFVN